MFVTRTFVSSKLITSFNMIIMIKTKRVLDIGVDSEDKKVKSNNIGILSQPNSTSTGVGA